MIDFKTEHIEHALRYAKRTNKIFKTFAEELGKPITVYASSVPLQMGEDRICILAGDDNEHIESYYLGNYDLKIKNFLDRNSSIGEIKLDIDGELLDVTRGGTEQGFVYKNKWAFYSHSDEICYIPELGDEPYRYQDFLELCEFQEFAEDVFDAVDWQFPETYWDEMDYDEVFLEKLKKKQEEQKKKIKDRAYEKSL